MMVCLNDQGAAGLSETIPETSMDNVASLRVPQIFNLSQNQLSAEPVILHKSSRTSRGR